MKNNRNTGCNNPKLFDKMEAEEKQKLLAWISENIIPRKTFNEKHTSYGLKHLFEDSEGGFYVENGTFKGAMLASGFKVKDEMDEFWVFNVSEKSKCFIVPRHEYTKPERGFF